MELCSILCGSLDTRGVWRRMDICMWMAESLCFSPETITILLIDYTPIQNKKFFKKLKKKKKSRLGRVISVLCFTRCWPSLLLSEASRKNLFPSSFSLLAEFSSLWLEGLRSLCWLSSRATLAPRGAFSSPWMWTPTFEDHPHVWKDSRNYIGSTWVTHDNLPTLRSATVIRSIESRFYVI